MKEYVYNIDLDGADAPALLLRAVGTDKKVLEVGCASGVQTRIMTEAQRCRITAIEIDAVAAEKAKEFCDAVIVGDLESLNLMDRLGDLRFDVITIADVLEHLRDPSAVLQKLKPFVASDGYIVASRPTRTRRDGDRGRARSLAGIELEKQRERQRRVLAVRLGQAGR